MDDVTKLTKRDISGLSEVGLRSMCRDMQYLLSRQLKPDSSQDSFDVISKSVQDLIQATKLLTTLKSQTKCKLRDDLEIRLCEYLGFPVPEWDVQRSQLLQEIEALSAEVAKANKDLISSRAECNGLTNRVEELAQDLSDLKIEKDEAIEELLQELGRGNIPSKPHHRSWVEKFFMLNRRPPSR